MNAMWITLIVAVAVILLYLNAVKPRNQAIHDWTDLQNHLYAHRGLHDEKKGIPENSLKGFERAVEAGYGIELDVQLSKDSVPVIMHDFDLKRMCGVEGKVRDYTLEELSQFRLAGTDEKIPTFEEVLKIVDGRVPMIIEYKMEGSDFSVCPIANRLLEKYTGPYIIESFHPLALSWYRQNRNDVIRGQLSQHFRHKDGYEWYMFLMTGLLLNFVTRPDFIAYNHENAKGFGFRMTTQFFKAKPVAWTIRSQVELDKAKENFDIFIFEKFKPNNVSIKKNDNK